MRESLRRHLLGHWPSDRRALLLAFPLAFLALAFLVPLATLLRDAASREAWEWVAGPYVRGRLRGAVTQALLSTLLAMAAALPLAWLHHAHRLPGTRLQLALHTAPFVMPVFVVVYGLQDTLGPHGWLADATGFDTLGLIGPLGAVALANAYYNYGFATRLLLAGLARRPHSLEEAARMLGASPAQAFWRTTGRLLMPAAAATAILVFLFSFASFGVALWLGAGEVGTIETLVYGLLQGVGARPHRAAALGAVQLLVNLLLLAAASLLWRRSRLPAAPAPLARKPTRALVALAWATAVLAALPLAAVATGSLRFDGKWSLEAWRAVLDASHPEHLSSFSLPAALGLSLQYAAWAVGLSVALCACLAYGTRGMGPAWRRAWEGLAALPLGLSSLLLGLALLAAFGGHGIVDLRGNRLLVVLAHTLVAFPFTARVLLPAFDAHDTRLDEAARLLGAPPAGVLRRIHLPLLWPALAAAAGFAATMSFADYGSSLLLMHSDDRGLAVWVGMHDQPFRAAMHAQAVALATLLAGLAAATFAAVERLRPRGLPP